MRNSRMGLGERVKKLRRKQGMTLIELSKRAEVSMSLLSLIERNISTPTVRTLEKIVKALGTTISRLYLEMENSEKGNSSLGRVTVVHKKDRKKLLLGPERGQAHYELLTPDYQRKLEIMYIHFPVGRSKGKSISHEGEECGIILEGKLKAHIGDQVIILEEGDSIYFDSTTPHYWENLGKIEVRAFWINTPPTF
jgi:transcriptional regulator with XRE-family HTH domain